MELMPGPFDPQPVTLEGRHVRLEPLARRHAEDLFEVGKDETIWPYMPCPPLKSVRETHALIDQALKVAAGGTQIPFAIVERLGAVREGVLRKHIMLWDGFIRDTVYYSLIESEWPEVKRRLEGLLEGARA